MNNLQILKKLQLLAAILVGVNGALFVASTGVLALFLIPLLVSSFMTEAQWVSVWGFGFLMVSPYFLGTLLLIGYITYFATVIYKKSFRFYWVLWVGHIIFNILFVDFVWHYFSIALQKPDIGLEKYLLPIGFSVWPIVSLGMCALIMWYEHQRHNSPQIIIFEI